MFLLVVVEPLQLVIKDAKEDIAMQLLLDGEGLTLIGQNTIPETPL